MNTAKTRVARWEADARDLSDDLTTAATYLPVGKVSDQTGLSTETILDSLTREPITNEANPRGALCNPAARIGRLPLWHPSQVAEYRRRVDAAAAEPTPDWPTVSKEEAEQRGWVDIVTAAERFGKHEQTLRKAQRFDATYPETVAVRAREGRPGPPEHLRSWAAIRAWGEARGYTVVSETKAEAAEAV